MKDLGPDSLTPWEGWQAPPPPVLFLGRGWELTLRWVSIAVGLWVWT